MQVDTIRKATTDAEKEQHCKEGRCFECSQQGHLARNCPKRPPCPPCARAVTEDKKEEEDKASEPTSKDLTARKAAETILGLNENQRATFIRAMVDGGQDFSLA
jgi:DNA-directed RNA polymerase specialized sigma24 family protein